MVGEERLAAPTPETEVMLAHLMIERDGYAVIETVAGLSEETMGEIEASVAHVLPRVSRDGGLFWLGGCRLMVPVPPGESVWALAEHLRERCGRWLAAQEHQLAVYLRTEQTRGEWAQVWLGDGVTQAYAALLGDTTL